MHNDKLFGTTLLFHYFCISQGFTHEEGLELLSKHVGTELPPEAIDIIKLSYGSPIVLDIIGSNGINFLVITSMK